MGTKRTLMKTFTTEQAARKYVASKGNEAKSFSLNVQKGTKKRFIGTLPNKNNEWYGTKEYTMPVFRVWAKDKGD